MTTRNRKPTSAGPGSTSAGPGSSPAARGEVDPGQVREAVVQIAEWIHQVPADASPPATPSRSELAAAVRLTARSLARLAPGASVEVRVPPFVAVQCIEGPRHARGVPPNVVEADPHTWLRLVTGLARFDELLESGRLEASGHRADEIVRWLPLVPLTRRSR